MGRRRGHLALPSPRAPLSFLSTFIHNMLAFGLTKKLCSDFLKKQATIGNLDEEQYKLLSDHIEQMATE